jgi:hypothetical protein
MAKPTAAATSETWSASTAKLASGWAANTQSCFNVTSSHSRVQTGAMIHLPPLATLAFQATKVICCCCIISQLVTPVPLNPTGYSPPPSCRTFMNAVHPPVSDVANLTSISQLVFAGTLEPQVVVVSTKSPKLVPVITICPAPRTLHPHSLAGVGDSRVQTGKVIRCWSACWPTL